MTDTTVTPTAIRPDGAPRIASLDVMRGIAIIGILFMNINFMGGSGWANFSDIRHFGWTTGDQVAWMLREVFANGTARGLLEMLFGVGMVILTDRAAGAVDASAPAPTGRLRRIGRWLFGDLAVLRGYYWRNIVLFAFGVAHLFILLWPGDILHTYAIAALIAFLFRRCGPKTLLALGLSMALLQLGAGGYSYLTVPGKRAEVVRLEAAKADGAKLTKAEAETLKTGLEAREKRAKDKVENAAKVVAEDKARSAGTGSFMSWARDAANITLELQSKGFEIFSVWEAAATMLIGAALYKWGIIQGRRSRRFYLVTLALAYGVGISTRLYGGLEQMRFDDAPTTIWALYEASRLTMTLGHVAAIQLLLATVSGAKLLKPFEAAGKTALTVYILQSILGLWLLYPPFALGLYGTQGWLAMMLTALAINVVLMIWAIWWVRHFRIAPVEWAWRSIVERRRLPMRKGDRSSAGGAVPVAA